MTKSSFIVFCFCFNCSSLINVAQIMNVSAEKSPFIFDLCQNLLKFLFEPLHGDKNTSLLKFEDLWNRFFWEHRKHCGLFFCHRKVHFAFLGTRSEKLFSEECKQNNCRAPLREIVSQAVGRPLYWMYTLWIRFSLGWIRLPGTYLRSSRGQLLQFWGIGRWTERCQAYFFLLHEAIDLFGVPLPQSCS